ncbi:MAG: hypothetical protein HY900_31200 [Deltaproteobacteria bacterium]|nr:hypothetical protein [Deltaproteobacteria bacterium]
MAGTSGAQPSIGSLWADQLRMWNACGSLLREQSERVLNLWGRQAFELQRRGQRFVVEQMRFAGRLGSGLCEAWVPRAAPRPQDQARPPQKEPQLGRGAAGPEPPRRPPEVAPPSAPETRPSAAAEAGPEPTAEAAPRQPEAPQAPLESAGAELPRVVPEFLPPEPSGEEKAELGGVAWQDLEPCPPGTEPEEEAPVLGPAGAQVSRAKRKCRPKSPKAVQGKGSKTVQ